MIAILGGLGAATAFAVATLCSSRSTRMIGTSSTVAWVMVVGLVALVPALAAGPRPGELSGTTLTWVAIGAVASVVGVTLSYGALRLGKVSIVAPIVSTEGAIAAVLALLAGEPLSAAAGVVLAIIALGVFLSSMQGGDAPVAPRGGGAARTALYAVTAALAFGLSLFAFGRVSGALPLAWIILPARIIGVAVIALPLLVSGRLRLTRSALPLVVAGGLCEIFGFAAFTFGARDGIAVAAVLASQFAAIAAIVAFVLFGERLRPLQVAGVVTIVAGVTVLSALQA
jgi:drug/metabolite transporter (DMT)-like permease